LKADDTTMRGTAGHRKHVAAPPARLSPPATYASEPPCADCPSQRLLLTLFPDHSYRPRRTYLSVNAPVLASVVGRFAERATDPGAAPREHLIIERLERSRPRETRAREARAQASLTNTYWRPMEIDGEAVTLAPEQREPHFVLASEGHRVQGFTGRNRMAGSFEQDADGLGFEGLATTRMACSPAIGYLEARFLDALNAVASQQIIGESLELRDASRQLRMRLESRYLP
ncbi:MAG: META domain-containing protein, partial [Gammaproteobacteria bacterium]